MVILLCYTSAFSEVIYADLYAKILDWNFRVVDENSRILVVFVSKLNFRFIVFVSSTTTIEFSLLSSSLWQKLIYCRQRKFSFSSLSTKKNTELYLPLLPSRRVSLHFGWYSFSIPMRVEGWVSLSGCLQTEVVYPPTDGHPSQY